MRCNSVPIQEQIHFVFNSSQNNEQENINNKYYCTLCCNESAGCQMCLLACGGIVFFYSSPFFRGLQNSSFNVFFRGQKFSSA